MVLDLCHHYGALNLKMTPRFLDNMWVPALMPLTCRLIPVKTDRGGTVGLRHCSASRKVAGSIVDETHCDFSLLNPSGRTMALGPTQSLTEISTRDILWRVKADGA